MRWGVNIRFLIISFLLHTGLLSALLFIRWEEGAWKKASQDIPTSYQIRVVQKEKAQKVPPSAPLKKTGPESSHKASKQEHSSAEGISKNKTSKPKGLSGSIYDPRELLRDVLTQNEGVDKVAGDPRYYGMDPHENLKDQPYLQKFASDLNDYLYVPPYLIEKSDYLYGWVRIKKSGGRYIVTTYKGTRYARSLLYEALVEVLKSKTYIEPLLQGDIKNFEVHFLLQLTEDDPSFANLPRYEVLHNRITITRYKTAQNLSWTRYLAVAHDPLTGLATVGPNVLAPLLDFVEFLTKEKEKVPAEVRALESSRAFKN